GPAAGRSWSCLRRAGPAARSCAGHPRPGAVRATRPPWCPAPGRARSACARRCSRRRPRPAPGSAARGRHGRPAPAASGGAPCAARARGGPSPRPAGRRPLRCTIVPIGRSRQRTILLDGPGPAVLRWSMEHAADVAVAPVRFETHPSRYIHWKLEIEPPIARLLMDVQEDRGLRPGYPLKLNSYDLGVDIELADAIQRLRFEHPDVRVVVVTSGKDRVFCSGANIYMLGASTHSFKVNFC